MKICYPCGYGPESFPQSFFLTVLDKNAIQYEITENPAIAELLVIPSNKCIDDNTLQLLSTSTAPILIIHCLEDGFEKRRLIKCLGKEIGRVVIIEPRQEPIIHWIKLFLRRRAA
jgi:hypothetical protein